MNSRSYAVSIVVYKGICMAVESIPTETPGDSTPPKTSGTSTPRPGTRINLRPFIIGIVGLIILALAARSGYNYYIDSTLYVTTEDAVIDSNMVPVAPLASGTLVIWRTRPGDHVQAGQVVGQIKPTTTSVY